MKYAVIDIGSNSVRLMLWANGTLYKKVCTTRLAEGISRSGVLCAAAMERTAEAVSRFADEGARAGAKVLCFATAAVRSASNKKVFCALVRARCAVEVDVIAGEEEALLGAYGAIGKGDGTVIDIGGASTEVCVRTCGRTQYCVSIPVGAVRIFDLCGQEEASIRAYVAGMISSLHGVRCIAPAYAIGGTASTLASVRLGLCEYDAEKLGGLTLPLSWLREEEKRLLALSVPEREKIPGMDVRRADVIAGAAVLLSAVMEALDLSEVRFSDADNLEGYLVARGLA